MLKRLSDVEVVDRYGDPSRFIRQDGTIDPMWEVAVLTTINLPAPLLLSWDHEKSAKKIKCHRDVAPELERIFGRIYRDTEAWASLDDYGGCYMWRANRNNPKARSRHCWGLAVDLDVRDNPNGAREARMHPRIIDYFAGEGWVWGGDKRFFPTPDPMHFEKGTFA